jgi:antitoxin MazE
MATKIQRWGNSQGLRVSKEILAAANLEVGDAVDVRAVDGTLVVTPLRRVRGRLDLAELVAAIPREATHAEVPWGEPEGDEL